MSSETSSPGLARATSEPASHIADPDAQTCVLHAVWLAPLSPRESGAIGLWGERAQDQTRDGLTPPALAGAEHVRAHLFALRDADLQSALARLWKLARPWVRPRAASTPTRLSLWLPTAYDAPYPSPELVAAGGAARLEGEIAESHLLQWSVPARLLDAEAAGSLLAGLPFTSDAEIASAPRLIFGGDLRFWSAQPPLPKRCWFANGTFLVSWNCHAARNWAMAHPCVALDRRSRVSGPAGTLRWLSRRSRHASKRSPRQCLISRAPPSRSVPHARRHQPRLPREPHWKVFCTPSSTRV